MSNGRNVDLGFTFIPEIKFEELNLSNTNIQGDINLEKGCSFKGKDLSLKIDNISINCGGEILDINSDYLSRKVGEWSESKTYTSVKKLPKEKDPKLLFSLSPFKIRNLVQLDLNFIEIGNSNEEEKEEEKGGSNSDSESEDDDKKKKRREKREKEKKERRERKKKEKKEKKEKKKRHIKRIYYFNENEDLVLLDSSTSGDLKLTLYKKGDEFHISPVKEEILFYGIIKI